ncbi:hypothetical protein B5F40_12200 [Gordonibacter sp. An230]|uniref:hypothetical protein n=1 Tax=Gordonibacter sp. An230 TaxID=1965592 RepID=UPI000B38D6B3|nr:hypothetical protein [Gordonibacter sp. An230]OUO88615.1 hypothetical protein B5F40_12200 [Gordonibacter sp. An230]
MGTFPDHELNARLAELSKIASNLFEHASITGTVRIEREEVLRVIAEQSEHARKRISRPRR